jgi:hypothetical protein
MEQKNGYYATHCISMSLGYMLMTPPHTASRTAHEIFSHFPFATFHLKNNKIYYAKNSVTHAHTPFLFEGHEDYKLILTTRNPYAQHASNFLGFLNNLESVRSNMDYREHFSDYIFEDISHRKNFEVGSFDTVLCWGDVDKEITHQIRVENILEDYRKIPFIKNSDLNLSGELEKILNKKIGNRIESSKPIIKRFPTDWKEFWSEETADFFYSVHHKVFELWGYDKDSWKK